MRRINLEQLESREAPAVLAEQTRTITPSIAGSSPGEFTEYNGFLYFQANGLGTGIELWRTDGTNAGTTLVKDIIPGPGRGNPRSFTPFNGHLYFLANSLDHGSELWRTDGTPSGTFLVHDVQPGPGSGVFIPPVVSGGSLYFSGNNGTNGIELWKTDGTSSGTFMVADLRPGSGSGFPFGEFGDVNGTLFFGGDTSATGHELYRVNGAGVELVRDIRPGFGASISTAQFTRFTNLNGKLAFLANDGTNGFELWTSDGTSAGTAPVSNTVSGSFVFDEPTPLGSLVYFIGNDGVAGKELWRTDGTSSGTILLADIYSGSSNSYIDNLIALNGQLYFSAQNNVLGRELWTSDGTPAGTKCVFDYAESSLSPDNLIIKSGKLYFNGGNSSKEADIWTSDGTSTGTVKVAGIAVSGGYSLIDNLAPIGNRIVALGNNGLTGRELYTWDGSSSTIPLTADLFPGDVNNVSSTQRLTAVGKSLFFSANDGVTGPELWASDGTTSGTRLVRDLVPGGLGSPPNYLANINGLLYYTAATPSTGYELFRSDGTSAGTGLVVDGVAGPAGMQIKALTEFKGSTYFAGNNGPAFGTGGELWRTTSTGIALVRNINPNFNAGSEPANFVNVNGTLYFSANDGVNGNELWRSDGTSTGTQLVNDMWVVANSSNPTQITPAFNGVLFTATSQFGNELWYHDAVANTTAMVAEFAFGSASSSPAFLTPIGSKVYFSVNDSNLGRTLWAVGLNGSTVQVTLVHDFFPGSTADPNMANFVQLNGKLVFTASASSLGQELWISDGTSSGTKIIKDIYPGISGSNPALLTVFENRVWFTANDGFTGIELWSSDGTAAGTLRHDLLPGFSSSNPSALTAADGTLFFLADFGTFGPRVSTVKNVPGIASITSPSPNGTYTTGQSLTVTLNFDEPATLVGSLLVTLDTGAVLTMGPFTNATSISGSYTVAAGETSADLNVVNVALASGSLMTDTHGNAAILTIPASNLAGNANLIVNPPPPTTVTMLSINSGELQRSRVTRLDVTLSTAVPLASLGAVNITRVGSPFTVDINNGLIATMNSNVLSLTFNGLDNGSLPDGRWRLNIAGINYQSAEFHRLFGDADANATVNADDFAHFGNAFGATGSNNPFDFNNDGTILADDFAEFGNRFGVTL